MSSGPRGSIPGAGDPPADGCGALIRAEEVGDRAAVRVVNEAAFETALEAELVEALRDAAPVLSLVAEKAGAVVGHILFSPVELLGRPDLRILGLAPMAVLPELQRRGIGSALVRGGLETCARLGVGAVVVLGHPGYYPRFGFRPAVEAGLRCEYEGTEEAFMVIELAPGYLSDAAGVIRYHEAFGEA